MKGFLILGLVYMWIWWIEFGLGHGLESEVIGLAAEEDGPGHVYMCASSWKRSVMTHAR